MTYLSRECQARKASPWHDDRRNDVFVDNQLERPLLAGGQFDGVAGWLQQARDFGAERSFLRYN